MYGVLNADDLWCAPLGPELAALLLECRDGAGEGSHSLCCCVAVACIAEAIEAIKLQGLADKKFSGAVSVSIHCTNVLRALLSEVLMNLPYFANYQINLWSDLW